MTRKTKLLISLIGIFFMIMICNTKVQAASASIRASSTSVTTGESVTITTTIYGAAWQVNLTGAVSQNYAGNTDDGEVSTITQTAIFTPSSAGTYTIYLSGNVSENQETTGTAVSDSITISVIDVSSSTDDSTSTLPEETSTSEASSSSGTSTTNTTSTTTTTTTLSSNANLKNLGITPNDFSGFKVNTTTYNVTVPNDVEQVTVYATLSDSNASLTGTGVHKLSVGENALSVVVTAQDGKTKKTYTINVTREAETETDEDEESDEETDNEETEEVAETANNASSGDLIKLEVTGYTLSPEFSSDVFEYTLSLNGDASSLDIITEGANHNVSIEIVGNEDLQEGENIITILVFNEETEENSTYQIIVNKTNIDLEGINVELNDAVNNANMIRYILLGIVIFIIICVIIFLIVRKKYIAKMDADTIYEYDEEDVDNINDRFNLDEEDDLFSRVNQEANKDSVQDDFNEVSKNENEIDEKVSEEDASEEGTEQGEEYFSTGGAKKKGRHF